MKTSTVRILCLMGLFGIALGLPACGSSSQQDQGVDAGTDDGGVRDGAMEDGSMDGDVGPSDGSVDVDDGVPPLDMGPPCEPDCTGLQCGLDPLCGESCGDCLTTQACGNGGQCVTAPPGSPSVTSLTVVPNTFTPSTTGTFSATVTDPQGLGTITSGTLRDPVSGQSYGDFAGSNGTYTFELGWDDINTLREIDAAVGGSVRIFEAVFTDANGNTATRQVSATMSCGMGMATCGSGECVSLTSITACGSCANDCTDVETSSSGLLVDATGCQAGAVPYCTVTLTEDVRRNCNAACTSRSLECDTTEQHFGGYASGYCAEPCSPVDSPCAGGNGTCTTVDIGGTPTDLCIWTSTDVSMFPACSTTADCANSGVCQPLSGDVVGSPLSCMQTPPPTLPAVTELGTQTGNFDFAQMYCQCRRP